MSDEGQWGDMFADDGPRDTPSQLPKLDFEGTTVEPKKGFYKCPFRCGDSRYPARKWKTSEGFYKHMKECPRRPSLLKKQHDDYKAASVSALAAVTQKVGDRIFFVQEIITKPTHVQRFNRMVRVRYEAEKRFEAYDAVISTIDFIQGCVYFNGGIRRDTLRPTMEQARNDAADMQRGYNEHCKLAEDCR